MPEPLEIYACTVEGCSYWRQEPSTGIHVVFGGRGKGDTHQLAPVRVFREEDVRPLWEALRSTQLALHRACGLIGSTAGFRADFEQANKARTAFPAPPEWRNGPVGQEEEATS